MRSEKNMIRFVGLACCLAFLVAGNSGCQQQVQEVEEVKTAVTELTGVVLTALGKYIYVAEASGYDIAVAGELDTAALIGKELRFKGEFVENRPYIFRADTIEVKTETGVFENIFTRTEELDLGDTFKFETREDFEALKITSPANTQEWEGREFGKVLGKLEKSDNGKVHIVVYNNRDSEIGRIVVDNMADYAEYYVNKLRLYDKFWFYLRIKDTVDRAMRTKTREMFTADVLFAGLF